MGITTAALITAAKVIAVGAAIATPAVVASRKAEKAQEKGQKKAAAIAQQGQEKVKSFEDAQRRAAAGAQEDLREFQVGVERNQTIIGNPLGLAGQAQTTRKVLTGQ